MQGGCFYLFQGKASANSLFIEDLKEAKQFIILANYYLKGYLKIHEYLLTMDGWNFIVRLNSDQEILSKALIGDETMDDTVWRIISERMRIILSTFVRFTNKKQGRTGSKVHSSYERFIFSTLSEAKSYLELMRKGEIKLCQRKKKYRGQKSHYEVPEKLGKGSIFLNSVNLRGKNRRPERVTKILKTIEILASQEFVASKWVENSFQAHFLPPQPRTNSKNHQPPP